MRQAMNELTGLVPRDLTTTDRLRALGYTHRAPRGPAPSGQREILDASGDVVFVGHVEAVNEWLRPQEEFRARQLSLFREASCETK